MQSRTKKWFAMLAAVAMGAVMILSAAVFANAATESTITGYITGYGWPDNTPPGGQIAYPQIHTTAGGAGTAADPVTIAVGHDLSTGVDVLDWPAGTTFYIPNLQKYFIVEDTCGDGPTPQNGPCHTGYPANTSTWLDVWVGGQYLQSSQTLACENQLTGAHTVIVNPVDQTYRVTPGDIADSGSFCYTGYGETPLH